MKEIIRMLNDKDESADTILPKSLPFGYDYVDGLKLYYFLFQAVPDVYSLSGVNIKTALPFAEKHFGEKIKHSFTHKTYAPNRQSLAVDEKYLIVGDPKPLLVSFLNGHQCQIISHKLSEEEMTKVANMFIKHKVKQKRRHEINLITTGEYGLELSPLTINKTKLNLNTHYNDNFLPVSQVIEKRLNTNKDKGIVMLYGEPGTGKTTYLRHLIARLKKKVMFIPPDIAAQIASPNFVNILISNPNSVLVVEDAENIILDRKQDNSSVVSVLLNLSDGLLSDCLNVQLICTFNTALSNIDQALLRKGRLIAMYEFKKLETEKAKTLSIQLGGSENINEPSTLSELYHQLDEDYSPEDRTVIGFRN